MKVTDAAGAEVKAGDFVVYGVLLGRSAGLSFGRVLEVRVITGNPRAWDSMAQRDQPRVKVQGVQISFGDPQLKAPGTLLFPETRMLVIEREKVPTKLLKMLEGT
jgi:hypothetical protein